jgi:eukaryotic-like serine/threonine-protein kinase
MSDADIQQVRQRLGNRYRIERELGRGGMGTVYLARDLQLDRPVALKVLPLEFARNAALRERFLRETRTSASFSHPNIVPVHAIEESDDFVAFAMGFVEGESLGDRVQRAGPLGIRELVRLLQDVGYALAYAHGRGVVHRDIKPDNIMLERATGRALLMDFGISRTITPRSDTVTAAGLTRVGEVVGTPEYMSPEQASAEPLDGRSDVYSLGLVAFFAATGRTVMYATSPQRIMIRQLTEVVPPLSTERPDLPPVLTRAIDRCVAKDADSRFQTAEALVEAIDQTQLAAPEIPVPIRGFAQDLNMLTLVVAFVAFLSWRLVINVPEGIATLDRLLPLVFLFGLVLTRVLQSLSVARRLAEAGFTPATIMRGMRATVEESESLRDQIRRSPASHARRRRTVRIALAQLPIAITLIIVAGQLRGLPSAFTAAPPMIVTPTGPAPDVASRDAPPASLQPAVKRAAPPDLPPPSIGGTILISSGLMLLAVSLVLLLRSPFRMAPGERVFRVVWLGPFGRAFLRIGTRGVTPAGHSAGDTHVNETARSLDAPPSIAPMRVPQQPAPVATPSETASLQTLEDRLRALEAWREGK